MPRTTRSTSRGRGRRTEPYVRLLRDYALVSHDHIALRRRQVLRNSENSRSEEQGSSGQVNDVRDELGDPYRGPRRLSREAESSGDNVVVAVDVDDSDESDDFMSTSSESSSDGEPGFYASLHRGAVLNPFYSTSLYLVRNNLSRHRHHGGHPRRRPEDGCDVDSGGDISESCRRTSSSAPSSLPATFSVPRVLASRETSGRLRAADTAPLRSLTACSLPGHLAEHEFKLGRINKVFAAEWLSDTEIIFGTKCNKLIVLDVTRQKQYQIQTLKPRHGNKYVPDIPAGIHAIATNPSRTLLATGGHYVNQVGVYRLPSLDPVCVGENAHKDWIFDAAWLDDEILVSGGRDGQLCVWKVKDDPPPAVVNTYDYDSMEPMKRLKCPGSLDRIRALAYNADNQDLANLLIKTDYKNATWQLLDVNTLKFKRKRALPYTMENVCMGFTADHGLYAVGSKSNVCFIDSRTPHDITHTCEILERGSGVRSLAFHGPLYVVGTGIGRITFYDVRNFKPLTCSCSEDFSIMTGRGWTHENETFWQMPYHHNASHAIYTMKYDRHSPVGLGQRLFVAGGPLPASLIGNYAALFH